MSTLPSTEGVSRRLLDVSESVTMAITAKARALRAAGSDVIGFGAGEPDFATPAHIVAAAQAACADEASHHYSAPAGLPALREAIAAKTERDSGLAVSPDHVAVANGGKQALYNAFQALVDPGDDVLLPAPYWVSYPEQIRLAGGRPVMVPTTADAGYLTTPEELEQARTSRTKALVFCSPSNPSGAVYPPGLAERIGRWAAERGIWVITDEIYEHLVYGEATFVSLPVVVPELAAHCIVVNGVAKTYAMTGWRVGWTIAPPGVTMAMIRLQSHLASNVSGVAQAAALAAVSGPMDVVAEMRVVYDRRRQLAHRRLNEIPGVRCPLPTGAFYVFPSFEELLGRRLGGRTVTTSLELCDALLDEARVALVPGEAFGSPGCARLSYVLGDDDLARGLDRIVEALS